MANKRVIGLCCLLQVALLCGMEKYDSLIQKTDNSVETFETELGKFIQANEVLKVRDLLENISKKYPDQAVLNVFNTWQKVLEKHTKKPPWWQKIASGGAHLTSGLSLLSAPIFWYLNTYAEMPSRGESYYICWLPEDYHIREDVILAGPPSLFIISRAFSYLANKQNNQLRMLHFLNEADRKLRFKEFDNE